ncbi:hypothetical protein BJV78DRAFT_1361951 [Lactifluus subvellereus]|nr:hypothetical protein BJV78DRAFT_1361951 [Lactifluus subvellereus]
MVPWPQALAFLDAKRYALVIGIQTMGSCMCYFFSLFRVRNTLYCTVHPLCVARGILQGKMVYCHELRYTYSPFSRTMKTTAPFTWHQNMIDYSIDSAINSVHDHRKSDRAESCHQRYLEEAPRVQYIVAETRPGPWCCAWLQCYIERSDQQQDQSDAG